METLPSQDIPVALAATYDSLEEEITSHPSSSKALTIAIVYSGLGIFSTTANSSSPAGVSKIPCIGRTASGPWVSLDQSSVQAEFCCRTLTLVGLEPTPMSMAVFISLLINRW